MRRRRERRRKAMLALCFFLIIIAVILVATFALKSCNGSLGFDTKQEAGLSNEKDEQISKEDAAAQAAAERQAKIDEADLMAAQYDYDGAIELLKGIEGYDEDTELQSKVAGYEETKASCVPVNIKEVTHIFYHTLVVDEERAFGNQENDPQCVGNNQWMTTIDEFNAITQEMYDRGYVLVSIHDLYEVEVDENGNEVYVPATIMLPEGKKAFVLSLDDLSYYHSYDNYGYAAKLIIDENGDVMNEYIDADGNTLIGAYDCVPLLDQFVEEHPDASYHGAKGIIALTGYNGVLGYRTDESYTLENIDNPDIDWNKRQWLQEHPDFNLEEERAAAKEVADAMKENGWEFASHTWGHLRVGDSSLERLKTDNEKWQKNVVPVVGETDCIIFAHGQDLEDWGDYDTANNEKYKYFRSEGFNIFCNVDASQYAVWFDEDYMRMGRRNLDGYRIYYNAIGQQNNVSDLFDAAEVLDPDRPSVPAL